jgi:hypothetical protein
MTTRTERRQLAEHDQAVAGARDALAMAYADAQAADRAYARACARLYGGLRARQAARHAAGVSAPVPCPDCLVEIPVVDGAGSYRAGAVHHELIYDGDDLPYATCRGR